MESRNNANELFLAAIKNIEKDQYGPNHLVWLCRACEFAGEDLSKTKLIDELFAKHSALYFTGLNESFFFNITEKRSELFVNALIRNKTITRMEFDPDFTHLIINSQMQRYLENTKSLKSLTLEHVYHNWYHERRLLNTDLKYIANALKKNTTLEKLDLSFQLKLTDNGIKLIIDALKENINSPLKEIKITGIQLSDDVKNELAELLKNNAIRFAYRTNTKSLMFENGNTLKSSSQKPTATNQLEITTRLK